MMVIEFNMTNAQMIASLNNPVFYDTVASNTEISQSSVISVTAHIPNNKDPNNSSLILDIFPRITTGI